MSKKIKLLAYIVLVVIILVLGYVIYSNATRSEEQTLDDKVLSEIKYLEVKLVNAANTINNIRTQNYKISVKKVEEQSETGEEDKEQYDMEKTDELNNEEEINWGSIQEEVEEIYTVMPTITLDLYQTNINQEDILKINNFLDELAVNVKANDKEKTLASICDMYGCIGKFIDNTFASEENKAAVKAKQSVLVAYSRVTMDEWEQVESDIQNGIGIFSALLTNTNINQQKQVGINKVYVILNELKNAAKIRKKEVFFIKYKNLLEELSNL